MCFSYAELCGALGKSSLYIHNIQKNLALPILKRGDKYSKGYKSFLEHVINLKTLGVSNEDIIRLLELEKKILHLLQLDSLDSSPTWYVDHGEKRYARQRGKSLVLLLTDYDLETSPRSSSFQGSLDFSGAQSSELFKGSEMGEDINRAIDKYREVEKKILEIVEREASVAKRASDWARSILRRKR
jgi:hypothetical protein